VLALAQRSVIRTARQPANVIAPLVFPLMLLAVNSGGLRAETHLPGFPTDSFLAFALAVPFVQGALFATMNTGTDLARDIQTGFLSRLSLTPMRDVTLIAGQLAGAVVLGLVQGIVYLSVGIAAGVHLASGPAGALVLLVFATLVFAGFGALGTFAALRTGSAEALQGFFPVFFVFLFISSMNIPRPLIETTWFRDAATVNPVSYLIECARSLIITGWDVGALARGFAVAGVGLAVAAAQLPHHAVDPGAGARVPAVLLHRLRRRAVARLQGAGILVPARLHGLPVRLRAAAGLRVRRRLHRLRHRS
jgi:ABC-2 type transport system permease protein